MIANGSISSDSQYATCVTVEWFWPWHSASQLLEIDIAITQKEVNRTGDLVLPANIEKTATAVFCFDNFDLCEETCTGANTTHCTNGIIIQCLQAAHPQPDLQNGDILRQSHGRK